MAQPTPIILVSEDKRHRGYRDRSGRFTLEQCNLSKANEAGNLIEYTMADSAPALKFETCEHCWP